MTDTSGLRVINILDQCNSDLDGVHDYLEQVFPNGGDGNADGIPDAEQSAVASLPDIGGSDYVTVDASAGCASVLDVSVSAESAGPDGDPAYDYPFGLVGFTLPCAGPAPVKIYFHGSSDLDPPYRKYGPTTPGDIGTLAWYTLPATVFGTASVNASTVATVELSLTDGQLGDSTGADGQIVDPGGGPSPDSEFPCSPGC